MKKSIWRRPVGWVFAASLILNAFFGAAFLARVIGGPPSDHGRRGDPILGFVRDAGPETRELAKRIRDERDPAIRAARGEARAAFRQLRDLMVAEPFDQAAFEAMQQQAREAFGRSRSIADTGVAELLSHMSLEERQALAERMDKRFKRHREEEARREERRKDDD